MELSTMDMAMVGVDEGNAHKMIRLLVNFDIDHNGTMYYVDLMNTQVRAYGYDGKLIDNYIFNRIF